MGKDTLYWSVYKNLENEIIDLSYKIHFDENQLSVYSIKIAELLLRCSVEIESIAKDLFFEEGGTIPIDENGNYHDLYFDTDCIQLLEEKWALSEKIVLVTAVNFHFNLEENKILTPLKKANKRGTSSADWIKAYQAVKHNRSMNLSKGNIKHLIRAMAALYLLNIYYRNEKYPLMANFDDSFDNNKLGSDLFSLKSCYISFEDVTGKASYPSNSSQCVYFEKIEDNAFLKIVASAREASKKQIEIFNNSPLVKQFIQSNPGYSFEGKHLAKICLDIGGSDFMQKIMQPKLDSVNLTHKSRREAILNKNQKIYPEIL
ncbi:MAG: hypothetical protein LBU84_12360 [Prevotella sp.]|nr:hypothetical protein [Prevotella sp.]